MTLEKGLLKIWGHQLSETDEECKNSIQSTPIYASENVARINSEKIYS